MPCSRQISPNNNKIISLSVVLIHVNITTPYKNTKTVEELFIVFFSIIYGPRDFNETCLFDVLCEVPENLNKMAEVQSCQAREISLGGGIMNHDAFQIIWTPSFSNIFKYAYCRYTARNTSGHIAGK